MLPQMLWYEWLISYIGVLICSFVIAQAYKLISQKKEINVCKLKNIVIILIFSFLIMINSIINYNIYRVLFNIFINILINKLIFKDNILKCTVITTLFYGTITVIEMIYSFGLLFTNIVNAKESLLNTILKTGFSTLVILSGLLVFEIKIIKTFMHNLINSVINNKKFVIIFLILTFFIATNILLFSYMKSIEKSNYMFYIIIFTFISVFFISSIIQYIKRTQAEEKEEVLLNFMSKYEQIIDRDRINRHETLNNLLYLKSFNTKGNQEYEKALNEIIKVYENKSSGSLSNVYNLPSGLKGIIYYKVNDMNNAKINIITNISNKVLNKFDKLESKNYFNVCKIIGILMDNALEASILSKDKKIILDIYMEEDDIVFYLENSCNNKVDINSINSKDFSTKGKGRGLGLYIVKSIIDKSQNIELKQEYNKCFISKLIIKTK